MKDIYKEIDDKGSPIEITTTTTTTTTPKSSRLNGVWGDPDVHDLTPTRIRHIERSVPIDPQKIFLKKRFANVLQIKPMYIKSDLHLDKENHLP